MEYPNNDLRDMWIPKGQVKFNDALNADIIRYQHVTEDKTSSQPLDHSTTIHSSKHYNAVITPKTCVKITLKPQNADEASFV